MRWLWDRNLLRLLLRRLLNGRQVSVSFKFGNPAQIRANIPDWLRQAGALIFIFIIGIIYSAEAINAIPFSQKSSQSMQADIIPIFNFSNYQHRPVFRFKLTHLTYPISMIFQNSIGTNFKIMMLSLSEYCSLLGQIEWRIVIRNFNWELALEKENSILAIDHNGWSASCINHNNFYKNFVPMANFINSNSLMKISQRYSTDSKNWAVSRNILFVGKFYYSLCETSLSIRHAYQKVSKNTNGDCGNSGNGTAVCLQKAYDTPEEICHNTNHRSALIPWGFFVVVVLIPIIGWWASRP